MSDSNRLMNLFESLDNQTEPEKRDNIVKVPFGWPGGKSKTMKFIGPRLPITDIYVSVFGGSGADILWRPPVNNEVYNDRYGGVTAFYRVIKDKKLFDKLLEWIELTVHSREEFLFCKETWKDANDPVERAARWYYMISYSFVNLGRNWGRSLGPSGSMAGKIRTKLKYFDYFHQRFKKIQIDNQDFEQCLNDYDSPETVFYCDPDYIDTSPGIYKEQMSKADHYRLLQTIFGCEGFVAVSGYSNPLYEDQDWDERYEYETWITSQSLAYTDTNFKGNLKGLEKREKREEILWIKDFGNVK